MRITNSFFEETANTTPKNSLKIDKVNNENAFYPFIELIRFIAILSMVWLHTDVSPSTTGNQLAYSQIDFLNATNHPELYIFFKQIAKFSVICFFMVSGFLIGGKLDTPIQKFLKNRFKSTFRPYIIALSITVIIISIGHYFVKGEHIGVNYIAEKYIHLVLESSFWFIPNYMFCVCIIFFFKNYADKLWFGFILFGITMINTIISCYLPGFYANHTTALTAFPFYVWLGIMIRRHNIHYYVKQLNPWLVGILTLFSFYISFVEVMHMYKNHHPDFFNVLRVSNQIYSISVFFFLINICPEKPNFGILNPSKESYGVYLYHFPILAYVIPQLQKLVEHMLHIHIFSFDTLTMIIFSICKWVLCYIIVIIFLRLNYRWKLKLI